MASTAGTSVRVLWLLVVLVMLGEHRGGTSADEKPKEAAAHGQCLEEVMCDV